MEPSMKSPRFLVLFLLLILILCGATLSNLGRPGSLPTNQGLRKAVPFETLRKDFRNPDMIYAPFIFWFWDEPLDSAKMAEISRVLCSQGFSPGYAHARKSMVKTADLPDEEWLGDKWFAAFGAALKEAEARKSYPGYCDEYWWPSLQANGRVLKAHPELRAESLRWEIQDVPGGAEVQVPASFFAVAAQLDSPLSPAVAGDKRPSAVIRSRTLQVIGEGEPFIWKVPADGAWRVYAFNKHNHSGFDGGQVNYIDARLAPAFIKIALEPYARRVSGRLGGSIPGDFIDNEGDYGWQLAWSDTLEQRCKERYGRDIRLWMPLAVDLDAEGLFAKARWEWFDLVTDIYAETFRALTDWHEKRGMYTTAHFWEEGIQPQVSGVADHMKMLRTLTMPGQDCLGRKPLRVHNFKEVESVAEFQNVRAATELMGAGAFEGTPWGTFNPPFLKQAVNAVTAWGMSHIIPHGVFTTRKLTGNPWLPDWYSENTMFPYLHPWTDFARRASFVNSMGHAVPDVLLYNPIESAWIHADADLLDVEMWSFSENNPQGKRINTIDRVYAKAIDDLTAARKFVDFAKAGGRVYVLAELPTASTEKGMGDPEMKDLMDTLKAEPTFTACPEGGLKPLLDQPAAGLESSVGFMTGVFPMLQHRRRIDGRDFFWLANNTDQWQTCEVVLRDVRGAASIWDCESGGIRSAASNDMSDRSKLALVFKPYEAYWLVFDPKKSAYGGQPERRPEIDVVSTIDGPWKVIYDAKIQPVMEYPMTPPGEFASGVAKPLEDWKAWGLEKFSGLLDYSKTISVDKAGKGMHLDLGKVCHVAEVWVNGKNCGARLWGPYVFDVGGALRRGANEVRVRIANLINNSYGEFAESGLLGPVRLVQVRRP